MKDFLLASFHRLRKLATEKDCLSWKGPTTGKAMPRHENNSQDLSFS